MHLPWGASQVEYCCERTQFSKCSSQDRSVASTIIGGEVVCRYAIKLLIAPQSRDGKVFIKLGMHQLIMDLAAQIDSITPKKQNRVCVLNACLSSLADMIACVLRRK